MATTPAGTARALPHAHTSRSAQLSEFFAPQRTPSTELPSPTHFLHNLALGVLEVFAGVREVEQLARWLTEDAYRKLVVRTNLATRARNARGMAARRPVHTVVSVHESSPADGIVEAVVVVRGPARTRALAVRLEGRDGRWRATSLALL
ncbi:Rv3235 family protein [Microbacterium jejuense]|uniref:Rv3235 family protein n=1 Tax=Microbacterium jejuense TaxID=1263637 RepID=UPI0031EF2C13